MSFEPHHVHAPEVAAQPARLLLIDQDTTTREHVASICRHLGLELRVVIEPADVEHALAAWYPSIVLIDLPALDLPSLDLTPRQHQPLTSPILIVITAEDTPAAVRAAYAAGAEDFVRKPFDPEELAFRLKIALDTSGLDSSQNGQEPFTIILDEGRLKLTLPGDRAVELTPLEAKLIRRFLLTPGVPVAREELMRVGWGRDLPANDNALEVSIRRLRLKIEDDPNHPQRLLTARGLGYLLRPLR